MNTKEFAALKVGDKVENAFVGTFGEVVDTSDHGLRVCWHVGTPPIFYSVLSTSWMHWSKINAETDAPATGSGPDAT